MHSSKDQAGPRAALDDEVFFHDKTGPKSGKVVAAGQHGCTVEHGGQHHKVKWEHVAGIKKRAQVRYTVLEKGEDGLLVRDQRGMRRYVGVPPEAKGERLQIAKSLPAASPADDLAKSIVNAMGHRVNDAVLRKSMLEPVVPAAPVTIEGLPELLGGMNAMVKSMSDAVQSVAAGGVSPDALAQQLVILAQSQQQLTAAVAALAECKPVINVEPKIEVQLPAQPAPVVHVAAPVVNVDAPQVHVSVPEQAAPVVHVAAPVIPAPVVHVAAPVVHVDAPQVAPKIEVTVPAPIVNVDAPQITVEMPQPRKVVTKIERDKDGNITRAYQEDA